MSGPDHHELSAALSALLAKLGPGIAGAVISLRFIPVGTSWGARALSLAGGVAAAVYLAPALGEWLGVASARIEASPMPTTEPMARLGNMSDTVVKRLADQA